MFISRPFLSDSTSKNTLTEVFLNLDSENLKVCTYVSKFWLGFLNDEFIPFFLKGVKFFHLRNHEIRSNFFFHLFKNMEKFPNYDLLETKKPFLKIQFLQKPNNQFVIDNANEFKKNRNKIKKKEFYMTLIAFLQAGVKFSEFVPQELENDVTSKDFYHRLVDNFDFNEVKKLLSFETVNFSFLYEIFNDNYFSQRFLNPKKKEVFLTDFIREFELNLYQPNTFTNLFICSASFSLQLNFDLLNEIFQLSLSYVDKKERKIELKIYSVFLANIYFYHQKQKEIDEIPVLKMIAPKSQEEKAYHAMQLLKFIKSERDLDITRKYFLENNLEIDKSYAEKLLTKYKDDPYRREFIESVLPKKKRSLEEENPPLKSCKKQFVDNSQ